MSDSSIIKIRLDTLEHRLSEVQAKLQKSEFTPPFTVEAGKVFIEDAPIQNAAISAGSDKRLMANRDAIMDNAINNQSVANYYLVGIGFKCDNHSWQRCPHLNCVTGILAEVQMGDYFKPSLLKQKKHSLQSLFNHSKFALKVEIYTAFIDTRQYKRLRIRLRAAFCILTDSHPGRGGAMTPMEKYTTGSAYSWSLATCLFGALSLSEWALIAGIICSLLTCGVNWSYRHKEYRLKVKSHDASNT